MQNHLNQAAIKLYISSSLNMHHLLQFVVEYIYSPSMAESPINLHDTHPTGKVTAMPTAASTSFR